jgi:hypothetical protein
MKLALIAIFLLPFATPSLAEAAGWVLIAPPRDAEDFYIRDAPVSALWKQVAAFDNAAQCEEQRMVEIDFWSKQYWDIQREMPDSDPKGYKRDLFRRWQDEFLLRCMPYDLWWRAQQPAR